ncbi:hypothetical protein F5Y09DRAFT_343267 [Xylaria sp. FL1042]|nr:hypothetical protein F5Y09DRAFT_343267 [Xylaria sp. FL1042]
MAKPNYEKHLPISMSVEESSMKLTSESSPITKYSPRDSSHCGNIGDPHINNATISFIPQDRGREQTIAWLNTGTCESLTSLLTERDQAARQIQRGPRVKGTNEVQQILQNPSCKAVEQLHSLKKQTEMAMRFGMPGVVVHNFSRSFRWNKTASSKLPSLQLKDSGARVNEIESASAKVPPLPFSPIDWFDLPIEGELANYEHEDTPQQVRSWTPMSEPGGWREIKQVDITDLKPDSFYGVVMSEREENCADGEENHWAYEGEYEHYDMNPISMALERK